MSQKFLIKSMEIEGFRGINEKKTIGFDKPLVFLFGNNGEGKSSVLGAVEWCLFGDVAYIRYMESRTKDELINSFNLNGQCKVKISFNYNDEEYFLTREKDLGSRDTSLILKSPEGEFEDEEAQNKCFTIFNLSFDDFKRAVYLHQESIRGLLIDDPKERDEAMDRLFGLERMRDIIESVPLKDIKDIIEDLQIKKDNIEQKTKGAILQCQNDLKKLEEEAEELSITKDKQTLENGKKIAAKLIVELGNIAKQHNFLLSEINLPEDTKELNTIATKIKSNLKECRTKVVEISEFSKLTKRKTDLENFSEKLEENRKELNEQENKLKSITKEAGNKEEIIEKNKSIDTEIDKLQNYRKNTDAKFRLFEDAIDCLDTTEEEICPVCEHEIDREKLIKKLKSEIQDAQQKEIKKIDVSIKELKAKKSKNEDAIEELEKINNKKEVLLKSNKEVLNNISKLLEQKYTDEKDLILKMENEVKKLDDDIDKSQKIYQQREKEFQNVDEEIEKLKAIYKVLKKKEEFDDIKVISPEENQEIGTLQVGIDKLRLFEKQLNDIIESMTNIQIDLATEMIEKSSKDIKNIYTILCNHPYFDNLQIKVIPRNVKGYVKNSYIIKAFNSSENKETIVSTRFSTGQINCVALSIYLALSKVLPHKLGFLILDDPSQNLDLNHKGALCSIFKEMKGDCQIIIATQDDEFQKMLTSKVSTGNDRIIYNFDKWDKRKGPIITES